MDFFSGIDNFLSDNLGFRVFSSEAGTSAQPSDFEGAYYDGFTGFEQPTSGYGDTYSIDDLDQSNRLDRVQRNLNNGVYAFPSYGTNDGGSAPVPVGDFGDFLGGVSEFANAIGRTVSAFRSPQEERAITANRTTQQRTGIPNARTSADQSGPSGAIGAALGSGNLLMYAALAVGAFVLIKKVR